MEKHHIGEIPRIDWMDRLTFREITYLNNDEKKKSNQVSSFPIPFKDSQMQVIERDREFPESKRFPRFS